jgi:hypothetical protein
MSRIHNPIHPIGHRGPNKGQNRKQANETLFSRAPKAMTYPSGRPLAQPFGEADGNCRR